MIKQILGLICLVSAFIVFGIMLILYCNMDFWEEEGDQDEYERSDER